MKKYKFCFDLDRTICENKFLNKTYSELKPVDGAVETLNKLKDDGHYIIILTARNMEMQQYMVKLLQTKHLL